MTAREFLKRLLPPKGLQALRNARCRTRDFRFFIWSEILRVFRRPRPLISDRIWYELQFKPLDALKYYGIPVPSLPPGDVQIRFTGNTGQDNLMQAFSFYQYICSVCQLNQINSPKVLDFGGGWGRIARFFLRDTKPELITIADCLSDSIQWLRMTNNPCTIIKNDPFPPIVGLDAGYDVIYAYSVFSHLSEKYLNAWVDYLITCLRPEARLVITTRGHQFIHHLKRQYSEGIVDDLTKYVPNPEELSARYANGEFQFYPTGGGGELDSDFYGETLIPRIYFEKKYGSQLVSFTEDVENVDQAVVVLRKRTI
jgi:hypothetical protein